MSVKLVTIYWSNYDSGISKTLVRGLLQVDTLADLPGPDDISGYRLTIGTEADIIDTAARYKMDSSGSWHVQQQGTDFYTKAEIDTMIAAKADAATTYTKTETDNLLNAKADAATTYTKTETDNLLNAKADAATTYTKTQTESRIQADVFGTGNNSTIQDNDDLDLSPYTTAGIYVRQTLGQIQTINGLPFDGNLYPYAAFKLKVEYINSVNNIQQTLIPLYSGGGFFTRVRMTGAGGTWRQWQAFTGTPV